MLYVRQGAARLNDGFVGHAIVDGPLPRVAERGCTALFDRMGDVVSFAADEARGCDALLLTGQPLREPVALGGPIVMNTEAELRLAYQQLRDGTFL
eukprot:5839318-Prymnesium_polylepis.1